MVKRAGWILQRRLFSEGSGLASQPPKALAAKAEIDSYCASSQHWSDPWTPCLTKHPPTPLELGETVPWAALGHSIIDQCGQLMMSKERFEEVMEIRQRVEMCLKEVCYFTKTTTTTTPNNNNKHQQLTEREFRLFTFGSCMSGLSTQSSDLDLAIMRYDEDGKSLNPVLRDVCYYCFFFFVVINISVMSIR